MIYFFVAELAHFSSAKIISSSRKIRFWSRVITGSNSPHFKNKSFPSAANQLSNMKQQINPKNFTEIMGAYSHKDGCDIEIEVIAIRKK